MQRLCRNRALCAEVKRKSRVCMCAGRNGTLLSFGIHTRSREDPETNREFGQTLFVYVMPESMTTYQALRNRLMV